MISKYSIGELTPVDDNEKAIEPGDLVRLRFSIFDDRFPVKVGIVIEVISRFVEITVGVEKYPVDMKIATVMWIMREGS